MKITAMVAICFLLLTGCAAPTTRMATGSKSSVDAETRFQQELAIQNRLEQTIRLHSVASRIRMAASALCEKNVGPFLGMYVNQPSHDASGDIVKKLYHLDGRVALLHVTSGSPAEEAGLQRGDVFLKVAGRAITSFDSWNRTMRDLAAIGQPLPLEIERAGQAQLVTVTPIAACNYGAKLSSSQDLNAFADGKDIVITTGMMNFVQTDEELALVVSHEIAHNMMQHLESKKTNMAGGLLADIALAVASKGAYRQANIANAAARAYSQEFEQEADYVGLYIMARAGHNIDDAPKFWRRMAVANPGNIKGSHASSHPSTASRMVALDATVAEIKEKQAAGQPLVPNLKEPKAETGTSSNR